MLLRSVRDQVENPETGHDVHAGRRCAKTLLYARVLTRAVNARGTNCTALHPALPHDTCTKGEWSAI